AGAAPVAGRCRLAGRRFGGCSVRPLRPGAAAASHLGQGGSTEGGAGVRWMAEAIHAVRCLVPHDVNPGASRVENRFASFPPYELATAIMRAFLWVMAVVCMAERINALRSLLLCVSNLGPFHV